jgi:hypothetical protein
MTSHLGAQEDFSQLAWVEFFKLKVQHYQKQGFVAFSNPRFVDQYFKVLREVGENPVLVMYGEGYLGLDAIMCKRDYLPTLYSKLRTELEDLRRHVKRIRIGLEDVRVQMLDDNDNGS